MWKKMGMLTTGKWYDPAGKMLHHVEKGLSGKWVERIENGKWWSYAFIQSGCTLF